MFYVIKAVKEYRFFEGKNRSTAKFVGWANITWKYIEWDHIPRWRVDSEGNKGLTIIEYKNREEAIEDLIFDIGL